MLYLLPGVLVKLATRGARRLGLMPQSTYVSQVMQALRQNDLDEAIKLYPLSVSRRRPSDMTEVARELIEQSIDIRIDRLQSRIDEIEGMLAIDQGFLAWIRRVWIRIVHFFGSRSLSENRNDRELRAEIAEHRAMIEGLMSIKTHLKNTG